MNEGATELLDALHPAGLPTWLMGKAVETEIPSWESRFEHATRIRVDSCYKRLLRQRALVCHLASYGAEQALAERCLRELEYSFCVLSGVWEMRLGKLDAGTGDRAAQDGV
jgi:hypothetical protein